MKKNLSLLITIIFAYFNIFCPIFQVKASTKTYMRVVSEKVYLYSDPTFSTKIFEVPYSYYVKVESIQQGVVKGTYGVEDELYPCIIGYLKLEELQEVLYTPSNPYSTIKVSSASSDVLFNDSNLKKPYFNVPENTFMIYYGKLIKENGSEISYVYCNNKLGYFDTTSLNPFNVPLHPEPIEVITPEIEEQPTNDDSKISSMPAENLQVLIIIGLSIICIAIVYALFKPSKQKVVDDELEN